MFSTLDTLPYLTLPYGEGVLPPSAEASGGPNACNVHVFYLIAHYVSGGIFHRELCSLH